MAAEAEAHLKGLDECFGDIFTEFPFALAQQEKAKRDRRVAEEKERLFRERLLAAVYQVMKRTGTAVN